MKTRKWTSWILLRWPLQLELLIFNWSIVSHWCDDIGKKRSPPAREKVKFRKQGDCEKSHWRWAKICSELKREQHNEYCQGSYESNGENCSKEKSCQKDQRWENMRCTDILITMCLIITIQCSYMAVIYIDLKYITALYISVLDARLETENIILF